MYILRISLTLLIFFVSLVGFSQVESSKFFSLEATAGFTDLEDFRVKSSMGLTVQIGLKNKFLLAFTYERFSYNSLYERAVDEYGAVSYRYDNSNTYGLYSGLNLVSNRRIDLDVIAGPTVSGLDGERRYNCGFDSCSKTKFSKIGRLGVGVTIKGAYSFTRNIYGLVQFNGHEDLETQWTRFDFRMGLGLRL